MEQRHKNKKVEEEDIKEHEDDIQIQAELERHLFEDEGKITPEHRELCNGCSLCEGE